MANTIQTYRVAHGELLVGDSVRTPGDFVPEASEWPSLKSHLNAGTLEITYVDAKVLNAYKRKLSVENAKKVVADATPAKTTKKRIIRKKVAANDGSENALSEQSV